jgi:RNA polymerase sigma-70 factor (ECF subfamily)
VTQRDVELVASLRTGDEQVFATLVDAWSPAMLRQARNYVRSTASAEDVVQETWLAVLKGLEGFRGDASLRSWTFRILTNIARKHGGVDARSLPIGLANDPPSYEPGAFRGLDDPWPGHWRTDAVPQEWEPEHQALSLESRAVITAALTELPPRQREVVELRDVHGFSSQEVCDALEISPENQRVLLHRGRSQVRAALDALMVAHP